jgi:cytochrome c
MNLREGTKYTAAILGSLVLVAVCGWVGGAVYEVQYLEKPAYKILGLSEPDVDLVALRRSWPQALVSPADRAKLMGYMRDMPDKIVAGAAPGSGGASVAPVEEVTPDFATAIPAADRAAGEAIAKRCMQCHDWSKGGPNKIGPNLYGLIGRARASQSGFSYSSAMQSKGGTWTYEDLFRYLRSPARFIPNNKMAFAGVSRAQDRLNLLSYMRTWADSPPALPPPKPTKPVATSHP